MIHKEIEIIGFMLNKFHQYRDEANKYSAEEENVKELALINAGKASALYELLERFDQAPEIKP